MAFVSTHTYWVGTALTIAVLALLALSGSITAAKIVSVLDVAIVGGVYFLLWRETPTFAHKLVVFGLLAVRELVIAVFIVTNAKREQEVRKWMQDARHSLSGRERNNY